MIIFIVLKYAYAIRSSKCDMLFCIYIVIESQVVKNLPINIRDSGDVGLIPMWERFSGEGNDNPLQYSKLENSRDRGALQATQLSDSSYMHTQYRTVGLCCNYSINPAVSLIGGTKLCLVTCHQTSSFMC